MQRRVAAVLVCGDDDGWALMRDVAAELDVPASYTLRAWLKVAVQVGYVELRERPDDREADRWRLTDAGRQLLDDVAASSDSPPSAAASQMERYVAAVLAYADPHGYTRARDVEAALGIELQEVVDWLLVGGDAGYIEYRPKGDLGTEAGRWRATDKGRKLLGIHEDPVAAAAGAASGAYGANYLEELRRNWPD